MKTPNNPNIIKEEDNPIYAPEDHALAEGIGAGGGLLAGAALGASLGPLGAVAGAVVGGVFGTLAGRGIAQATELEAEDSYWKEHYSRSPYHESGSSFTDYGPAYRFGWLLYTPDVSFEMAEKAMNDEWEKGRGTSKLEWSRAREAAKEGWEKAAAKRKELPPG